jgi:hypothetical protein
VPRAKAPIVDGTLAAGEWDKARVEKLTNGGELLLQHDGEYLYVGIRVPGTGIASLCVPGPSKRALVLHASAALATAEYEAGPRDWRLVRNFSFEIRDTGTSAEAMSKRAAFLAAEGWFANASGEGSREREFQISWKLGDRKGLPLTVAYMTFPDEKLYSWPASLAALEQFVEIRVSSIRVRRRGRRDGDLAGRAWRSSRDSGCRSDAGNAGRNTCLPWRRARVPIILTVELFPFLPYGYRASFVSEEL